MKENVAGVDPSAVLEQVVQIPVSTWNYIGEEAGVRHMGPMAQDFYAAFGLGDSERHINSLDADGVALASIQGLYGLSQEQAARIEELQAVNAAQQEQIQTLQRQNAEFEARLAALEGAGPARSPFSALPGGWWLLGGLVAAVGLTLSRRLRGGG